MWISLQVYQDDWLFSMENERVVLGQQLSFASLSSCTPAQPLCNWVYEKKKKNVEKFLNCTNTWRTCTASRNPASPLGTCGQILASAGHRAPDPAKSLQTMELSKRLWGSDTWTCYRYHFQCLGWVLSVISLMCLLNKAAINEILLCAQGSIFFPI